MLDKTTKIGSGTTFLTMEEARQRIASAPTAEPLAVLLGWVENYLMRAHPDLGRTGAVCPFTRQAGKLDTVRLAMSAAGPSDEEAALVLMRACFEELESIAAKPGMEHFRTVIVGFPNCAGEAGVNMLGTVQKRLRLHSLRRFRMIGFMHASNEAPGLCNPAFRPLTAPLPVLAVRHLVVQDAPFALRHKPLLVPYLIRFPLAGPRRLISLLRGGANT